MCLIFAPSSFPSLDTVNSRTAQWLPPGGLISPLANQFFVVGQNYVRSSFASGFPLLLSPDGSWASQELFTDSTLSPAMHQASIEKAGGPVAASSGLRTHVIASIRKCGPRGLLLAKWPGSLPYHNARLSHSPVIFLQKLVLLLVTFHGPATVMNQHPTLSPAHTQRLCVPPGSLSCSPPPRTPEFRSALLVDISNPHGPSLPLSAPLCRQRSSCWRMSWRSKEPSLKNGSSLGNKRTLVG